jgi:predicted Rossmann-fold nucleotide-binding protein
MVMTGAGSGVMGSAQEGAGREKSFGLNIRLPFEQEANPWILDDPKLITFKYFFTRKLFLVREAQAMAYFPGGFGTADEAFETLTLIQTGKAALVPVVLVDAPGGKYWESFEGFIRDHMAGEGMISPKTSRSTGAPTAWRRRRRSASASTASSTPSGTWATP